MALSSRPPEGLKEDTNSGIQLDRTDREFLARIGAGFNSESRKALEDVHRVETVTTLFEHLKKQVHITGDSVFETLAKDYLWHQLFQDPRWANVASLHTNRIALLKKLLHQQQHSSKLHGRATRVARIQKVIDDFAVKQPLS